jgi:hypothetical protein
VQLDSPEVYPLPRAPATRLVVAVKTSRKTLKKLDCVRPRAHRGWRGDNPVKTKWKEFQVGEPEVGGNRAQLEEGRVNGQKRKPRHH